MKPVSKASMYEGQSLRFANLSLCHKDAPLVQKLAHENAIVIDELKDGLRISAKSSWVGVISFESFDLQIRPKFSTSGAGDETVVLANVLDFISDTFQLKILRNERRFDASGDNLFELIVASFVDACEKVIKKGILPGYVEVDEPLPVLRGRMLLLKQFQKRFGRLEQIECNFDEHTPDIAENKIILATLNACFSKIKRTGLKTKLRNLIAIFEDDTTLFEFDFALAIKLQTYNRLNEYYRHSHELAALIMSGLSYRDIFAANDQRSFAFLFQMHSVFEKFVSKLLTLKLNDIDCIAHCQKGESRILWNADADKSHANLIPDISVESRLRPGVFVPIDVKYKVYDDVKVSTSDIYQTFAYALSFGHSNHTEIPTSIIVYCSPESKDRSERIHVRRRFDDISSGEIIVVPLNLSEELCAFREKRTSRAIAEIADRVLQVLRQTPPARI